MTLSDFLALPANLRALATSEAGWDDRAVATVNAAAEAIERLWCDGVHTCSDACQRPLCVLRRENEALRAELSEQRRLNGMGAEREHALRGEVSQLRRALNDTIQAPAGVVPTSAEPFYDGKQGAF